MLTNGKARKLLRTLLGNDTDYGSESLMHLRDAMLARNQKSPISPILTQKKERNDITESSIADDGCQEGFTNTLKGVYGFNDLHPTKLHEEASDYYLRLPNEERF